MLPVSLDFASLLGNGASTSRDTSSAVPGNAFSTLLQLAQLPQGAQSAIGQTPDPSASSATAFNGAFPSDAFTGNSGQNYSAPSDSPANGAGPQDGPTAQFGADPYCQAGYGNATAAPQQPAQPAVSQTNATGPAASAPSLPQNSQSSPGSESTSSETSNGSASNISQNSSDHSAASDAEAGADAGREQTAAQGSTAGKNIKADGESQPAARGVVLDLSQLATASAAAAPGKSAPTKPGSAKSDAAKSGAIKGAASAVKGTNTANAAAPTSVKTSPAPQNASSPTASAVSAGPSDAAKSGSSASTNAALKASASAVSTTSGNATALGASGASSSTTQGQASSAPGVAGAATLVAPRPSASAAGTSDAQGAHAAPAIPVAPRTASPQQPLASVDSSSDNPADQGSAGDISFGAVLDAIASRGDAAAATTGTSAAATDAKPAAAANAQAPTGASVSDAAGQSAQQTARATTATTEPAAGGGVSQSDNARFVQRVEQAFQSAGSSGGSIRLRLSPPDLGDMQINISLQKGTLTANVQTDTAQARNLLLDNLPELRDRLAQHNIKIETFNVDLSGNSSGGTSGQGSGQYAEGSRQTASLPTAHRLPPTNASTTTADAPALQVANQNGSLNIVI